MKPLRKIDSWGRRAGIAGACMMSLTAGTGAAAPPSLEIRTTVFGEGPELLDPFTGDQTLYRLNGTRMRFDAYASGPQLAALALTVQPFGQPLQSYGPPGQALNPAGTSRRVPGCARPIIACYAGPMVTLSERIGRVTVSATATNARGAPRRINVTFVPVGRISDGSPNPAPPPATDPCAPMIPLFVAYNFDNGQQPVTYPTVYVYASVTFIGPGPGEPFCAQAPGPISAFMGPFDTSTKTGWGAGYPTGWVGWVPRRGRWRVDAYSPQVDIAITCVAAWSNNVASVVLRTDMTSPNC